MFCRYCGAAVSDSALFCPSCGGETSAAASEAAPVRIEIIQGSALTQKTKIPTAAKVLLILFACGVLMTIFGIFIPMIIGYQGKTSEAFKHSWTYDFHGTEMVFDFPRDKVSIELFDTPIDFDMEWSRKGRVLTLSVEENAPETYRITFGDRSRKMVLTNSDDSSDVMILTRIE